MCCWLPCWLPVLVAAVFVGLYIARALGVTVGNGLLMILATLPLLFGIVMEVACIGIDGVHPEVGAFVALVPMTYLFCVSLPGTSVTSVRGIRLPSLDLSKTQARSLTLAIVSTAAVLVATLLPWTHFAFSLNAFDSGMCGMVLAYVLFYLIETVYMVLGEGRQTPHFGVSMALVAVGLVHSLPVAVLGSRPGFVATGAFECNGRSYS